MVFALIFLILSILTSLGFFISFQWYLFWYLYIAAICLVPIFYLVYFLVFIVILFIWSLFLSKKKEINKPNKLYYFIVREVCFQLDLLSRTKVVISGEEKLPKGRYLVISNHISMFDAIIMIDKFMQQPIICVTKMENERIPICGPFIHNAGFLPLDRSSAQKAIGVIKKASNFIENDWSSIYICPEGTRSKDKVLLPFHGGSFKIAYKANVPIVVCNFTNTDLIRKNFPWKKTVVNLDIIEVIEPSEFKLLNTNEMAEKTRNIILNYQSKEK